ncbi:ribosome maturation factor RimP [Aquabacterium fontiphilum]|uniref:ribosome maturation factor RimP n=1 Tax=Aquabacterium fontiphilum TaxID=450365 RepID=UPI00137773CE|nr:ribosome maturation factor RimP [Aquabacterium fontiphilum]NBD19907.1 ribosome maturation factor RimP [Aquabacterium fontiphilum]
MASWLTLIESTVTGLGFELVDCERSSHGLLRVYIDRLPGQTYDSPGDLVTVEDCEKVTRQLQYALETVDADYARLEVSSPGVDRPLKTPAHFARFVGEEIEIALKHPFQGRKRYTGVLCASPDGAPEAIEAGLAWGLILPPAVPRQPVSRTAAKKKAKEEARAAALGETLPEQEVDQVMGFTLDEIREARLVPVVSFKGRRAADASAAGQVAVDEAEELGGQKK